MNIDPQNLIVLAIVAGAVGYLTMKTVRLFTGRKKSGGCGGGCGSCKNAAPSSAPIQGFVSLEELKK